MAVPPRPTSWKINETVPNHQNQLLLKTKCCAAIELQLHCPLMANKGIFRSFVGLAQSLRLSVVYLLANVKEMNNFYAGESGILFLFKWEHQYLSKHVFLLRLMMFRNLRFKKIHNLCCGQTDSKNVHNFSFFWQYHIVPK